MLDVAVCRLQGNSARALLHLRTSLHSSPDSLRLRAALSEALRLDNRPEQARQVVQRATRPAAGGWGTPDSVGELGACVREAAECLFALGWDAERNRHNEQLFRDLQRWVKLDPADPGARAVLALAAALRAQGGEGGRRGRWEAARRLCNRALQAERRTEESDRRKAAGGPLVAQLKMLDVEALSHSCAREDRELSRWKAKNLLVGARGREEEIRARAQYARSAQAMQDRRTPGAQWAAPVESGGSVQGHLAQATFEVGKRRLGRRSGRRLASDVRAAF